MQENTRNVFSGGGVLSVAYQDINYNLIQKSKYLYLEGYLWDNCLAKNAFLKAAKIAKDSNTKIILSLSDSFCIDRHRESFLELINNYIDVVFCNESEVLSLFKENDLSSCKESFASLCQLVIITLDEKSPSSITLPIIPFSLKTISLIFKPFFFPRSITNEKSSFL